MPNAKILEEKKAAVASLTEKVQNGAAGVLVKYQGITVEDDTKLRAELRKAGVEYAVIKNSIIKRALNNAGYTQLDDQLNGMNALAVSANDQVAAAKILKQYAEKIESFEIRGGFVDGNALDAAGVNALADTLPREQLIGKILGSIQGPLYSLAYALQAIIDKQNGSADAPAEAPAENA